MKRFALVLVLALGLGLTGGPAKAVVAVAGPGSYLVTYTQPVTVTAQGGPLTFVNADLLPHDFVALDETRPDGSAPWCVGRSPGTCPLFWTTTLNTGESSDVFGLADAQPGVHQFYCTLHEWMTGVLVVG